MHPDQLGEEYGIPQEQTIWISQTVGPRNINPQNMGILTETVVRFLSANIKSIVFLEGLEYLIAQNDFTKVLKFINHAYEAAAINRGIMVFLVDPRAFSAREMAFLEKCAVAICEGDEVVMKMSD
jgi:archaellum biogenesis ATPase FlaH